MIIGISGKKQSGKDSICNIIRALDIWDRRKELNIWTTCKDKKEFAREFVKENTLFLAQSKWEKHAFADKLKQTASILLDVPVENWESGEFKNETCLSFSKVLRDKNLKIIGRENLTNRNVLQCIGEGLRYFIDPDIWVNSLFRNYTAKPAYMGDTIKPDCEWDFKYPENQDEEDLMCTGISTIHKEYPFWIIPDVRMPNEVDAIKKFGGIVIRVERAVGYDTHISEIALDDYQGFDFIINNNGSFENLINQVIKIYDEIN